MRKISLVLLSIGALLALSIYWQGPATAQDLQIETPGVPLDLPRDTETCWGDWWFAQKVAGTYLMWAEWDPETEPVFPMILTINAEHTMVSTSSAALGRDDHDLFRLRQNIHTTWERTGQRELTTRHLMFMHDPAGPLEIIIRTTGVWNFDHDFEEFSVQFDASLFTPDQLMGEDLRQPNPNYEGAPYAGPYPSFVSTGKRLHVE